MATSTLPRQEIRFAVVLNGGVSLAVWMGGAMVELDALTRARPRSADEAKDDVWGRLCTLLNLQARADVITGTSAGGINGAALALSQVNQDARISLLRDLWAEQGRMESLLQRPFRGSPASLLRGDDYFLPALKDAMVALTKSWRPTEASERPIDLTITTTLLSGARTVTVDSLGQQLPQTQHEGRFHFRRGADDPGDFRESHKNLLAQRLALAARCTAGFPMAFEPSFVPAQGRAEEKTDEQEAPADGLRPDMGAVANWRTAGPADTVPEDRSRYCVDGGVLANTPTKDALEAINRMPSGTQVQRVMLLVYPHAPLNRIDPPDLEDKPPSVAGTMIGLLGALSSQGSRTFVDQVEEHNKRAASRRGTRRDVLAHNETVSALRRLAVTVYPHYRALRVRRAARDLAARVTTPSEWSYERIRLAAEEAQRLEQNLPYIPAVPANGRPTSGPGWDWGATTATDIADACLEIVQEVSASVLADADTCGRARVQIHQALSDIRAARSIVDDRWKTDPVLTAMTPGLGYWQLRLAAYAWHMNAAVDPQVLADRATTCERPDDATPADVVSAVTSSAGGGQGKAGAETRAAVCSALQAVLSIRKQVDRLQDTPWRILFRGLPGDETLAVEDLMSRMLSLHVASWAIGDETTTENTQPLNLVQLSLQTKNAFARYSIDADDKVGGTELNRFGGFLKRSWRMNDWTWGRLDAATNLAQVVISPARVRQWIAAAPPEGNTPEDKARSLVRQVLEAAFGVTEAEIEANPELKEELASLRARAVTSLLPFVDDDPAIEIPVSLPDLAALAAYPRQMQIAREELPVLAAAVKADGADGGNTRSRGQLFLGQEERLLARLAEEPGGPLEEHALGLRALLALDRAGIGREPLDAEVGSDQMIRTAATAASVMATVLDSPRSGMRALKPVTRAMRGFMLFPYWVVQGLTSGQSIARFLALIGLSAGGVMLALALLGVLGTGTSHVTAVLGVATALLVFGFAALRSGTILHGVVLLSPVIPLAALGVWLARRGETDGSGVSDDLTFGAGASAVVVVLAIVLGCIALGSIPSPVSSPFGTAWDLWSKGSKVGKMLIALVPVLAVGGLVVAVLLLDPEWSWTHTAVVAGAVVGAVIATVRGRGFRIWAVGADEKLTDLRARHDTAVTVGWSVIYGVGYLALAWVFSTWWPVDDGWGRDAAMVTTLVFAGVLLLIVPTFAPTLAHRRVKRDLVHSAELGLLAIHPSPAPHRVQARPEPVEGQPPAVQPLATTTPAASGGGVATATEVVTQTLPVQRVAPHAQAAPPRSNDQEPPSARNEPSAEESALAHWMISRSMGYRYLVRTSKDGRTAQLSGRGRGLAVLLVERKVFVK